MQQQRLEDIVRGEVVEQEGRRVSIVFGTQEQARFTLFGQHHRVGQEIIDGLVDPLLVEELQFCQLLLEKVDDLLLGRVFGHECL